MLTVHLLQSCFYECRAFKHATDRKCKTKTTQSHAALSHDTVAIVTFMMEIFEIYFLGYKRQMIKENCHVQKDTQCIEWKEKNREGKGHIAQKPT